MGWKCAVPNCKIKSKKGISSFKVPTDANLREKWIAAIPSVSNLWVTERVCEKHFEEDLIVREYIQYDANGKLIAQVKYQHARLRPGAVPTIFHVSYNDRSPHRKSDTSVIDHSYAVLTAPTVSTQPCKIVKPMNVNSVCMNNRNEIREEMRSTNQVQDQVQIISSSMTSTCNVNSLDDVNTISMNEIADMDVESKSVEDFDCNDSVNINAPPSIGLEKIQESKQIIELTYTMTECCTEESSVSKELGQTKESDSPCVVTTVEFECVTFSFDFSSHNNASTKHSSIIVPKPWNVCKCTFQNEDVLSFIYLKETEDCGIQKHIFEKAVFIRKSGEITYEVYSLPIDIAKTKLPKRLVDHSLLPEILKKFKDIRLCKGITVNSSLFSSDSIMKNGANMWQDKNCTIISINKERCSACKKFKKILYKKCLE